MAENSHILYFTDGKPVYIAFNHEEYCSFTPFSECYGCFFLLWVPSSGFASDQIIDGIIEADLNTKRFTVRESPGSRRLGKAEQKHVPLIRKFFLQHVMETMAEDNAAA